MSEPRVGDRLGDYHLSLELARGGMATVFLARAPARAGTHRFVAVKCIRKELAQDSRFIDMFFDEARIAAQVHHANVCSVLDFDVWRGTYYLVMEYLAGRSLAEVRRGFARETDVWDTELQTGIVARMLADACEGLHSVHELCDLFGEPLNVVHRDVSPGNLFVTYDGNVKVIDFGVAYGSGQRHKTRTGVLKGKYGYLAPELLEGKKPDRRADIWGLGVVAWELLTHQRLFERGNELETLAAISKNDPPPPSSVRGDIPEALDEIVMSALQRDPEKRCDSARALGRAFNAYLVDSDLCVGLPEVSEAMTALFPEGRALNRKLLQVADQIEEMTVAEIDALGGVCISETQCEEIEIDESAVISSAEAERPRAEVAFRSAELVGRAARAVGHRFGAGLTGAAAALLVLLLSPCAPLTPSGLSPVTIESAPPAAVTAPDLTDRSRVTVVEDYDEATGEIILRLRPATGSEATEPAGTPFPPVVRNSYEAPLMGPTNGT